MNKQVDRSALYGTLDLPPSKSDSQRAILLAGIANGESIIHNIGNSNDERAMLNNIKRFGAEVTSLNDGKYSIKGTNEFPANESFNVGESGLGLRLMIALCAAHRGKFTLTGEGSLMNRTQGFICDQLTQLGLQVDSNDGYLPITMTGQLPGNAMVIDGSVSSQFLSGLLLALPLISKDSHLEVKNLKSYPYAQMTIDTMHAFGVEVENKDFELFDIKGKQVYQPIKYAVESDWSAASFWLVAAAIGHDIRVNGLSMDSHQADKALLDALVVANCLVSIDNTGITVDGTSRKAFSFDATHCPDLFPALVTLASNCIGTSRIIGVRRLQHKESDRGLTLQKEFAKIGVKIELVEDVMLITPGELVSAKVESHNDHRIAMCLGIAATMIEGGLTINGAEAVNKSYPSFWKDLDALTL